MFILASPDLCAAHKENDTLSQKTQRLQQELEEQINTNNQLLTENNQRQIELKTKDDEIAAVKSQALKDRCVCVCVCVWGGCL